MLHSTALRYVCLRKVGSAKLRLVCPTWLWVIPVCYHSDMQLSSKVSTCKQHTLDVSNMECSASQKELIKMSWISTCNFDTKYPNLHYNALKPKDMRLYLPQSSKKYSTTHNLCKCLCKHHFLWSFRPVVIVIWWVSELKIWLIEGLIGHL